MGDRAASPENKVWFRWPYLLEGRPLGQFLLHLQRSSQIGSREWLQVHYLFVGRHPRGLRRLTWVAPWFQSDSSDPFHSVHAQNGGMYRAIRTVSAHEDSNYEGRWGQARKAHKKDFWYRKEVPRIQRRQAQISNDPLKTKEKRRIDWAETVIWVDRKSE